MKYEYTINIRFFLGFVLVDFNSSVEALPLVPRHNRERNKVFKFSVTHIMLYDVHM